MKSTPLTSQVINHVLTGAEDGTYTVTCRLPSERELAEVLAVSRNTVTAAYSELESRGLVRRIHGKGAFLCARTTSQETFSWSGKMSRYANALDEPVLELLARSCAGTVAYPLSAGTPSLEAFPTHDYVSSVAKVLQDFIPSALAVAPAEGQWRLRVAIAKWLGLLPNNIMITAGAQEGIDLVARCLIEPGDHVVFDSPTYPGALQSFLSAGAKPLAWGTDWSLAHLEKLLLRYKPKLIFTMPTLHNPTGRTMSRKTRLGLLELARRYRVPVLEDDVYRELYFGQRSTPESLYDLDQHSLVVNVSTFSKMLAPGLRIGWLTAPLYLVKQLALIKMRSNLFTGALNQLALADMVESGAFDTHLGKLRSCHSDLCDTAVRALEASVRKGLLRFRVPAGGLYLWCKVLVSIDMELFFLELEERGVSVAPGIAFRTERAEHASTHFRICFTAINQGELSTGLQTLNRVLQCHVNRQPAATDRRQNADHAPGIA